MDVSWELTVLIRKSDENIFMSNKIVNKILRDALEGENLSSLTKKLGLPKGFLFKYRTN